MPFKPSMSSTDIRLSVLDKTSVPMCRRLHLYGCLVHCMETCYSLAVESKLNTTYQLSTGSKYIDVCYIH